MIEQKFLPSIDPSSIIWDRQHYVENRYAYRDLIASISRLLEELKSLRIVVSQELMEEMINCFPASEINNNDNDLWAFVSSIYTFLSALGSNAISYNKIKLDGLQTIPDQLKPHFNSNTISEIKSLTGYFHNTLEDTRVYFSFGMFWDESQVLCTKLDTIQKKHKAVLVDRNNEFDEFLSQFILKFEHKTKHDVSEYKNKKAWLSRDNEEEFVSQLSCLRTGEETINKLLESRYDVQFGNQCYYSYDSENDVYVVFRITSGNTYHAHDEYNINNIPSEVKQHFNIHKYNW